MIFVFGYLSKQTQRFRDSLWPLVTEVTVEGWRADFKATSVQDLLAEKINKPIMFQPDPLSRMRAPEQVPDGFDPKQEPPCCDPPEKL